MPKSTEFVGQSGRRSDRAGPKLEQIRIDAQSVTTTLGDRSTVVNHTADDSAGLGR